MSNRSVRIQVNTQENMTDKDMSRLMALHEKYGHFLFLADDRQIDTADLIDIPDLPVREEEQKSKSQRLRAVLFILWKQNGEKGDFEIYYHQKMEAFIDAVKNKLS